jgi:molecular chaperone GrpE
MKQKKKHDNKEAEKAAEQVVNQTDEKVDTQEATETDQVKPVNELAELQQKYDEVNDKYLRLYSEFDNFRKRALKEKIELSKTATEQVVTDLLTIIDDFERAIASFEKVESVEPLKEGTILIYNKLKNNLTQKGLTEIDAKGQVFDTDFHEAIANVPAASEGDKNKILDVAQKGYMLNGKVIRFAKVVVNN